MQLATQSRYAIRILFELGQFQNAISIAALSEKTGIALRTIETITAKLRHAGITSSVLGAGGGIVLKRPLRTISLGDIVMLFEQGTCFTVCCGNKSNDCPNQSGCPNRQAWNRVSRKFQAELETVSLAAIFEDGAFALLNQPA